MNLIQQPAPNREVAVTSDEQLNNIIEREEKRERGKDREREREKKGELRGNRIDFYFLNAGIVFSTRWYLYT